MSAAAAVPNAQAWDVFSVRFAIRELWAKERLAGGMEYALLDFIWEQTWAKTRKPKTPAPAEARLSQAQIARAIGAHGKNAGDVVQRLVVRLKKAGIIATRKEGKDQVLWYRLMPNGFADAPKYEPPKLTPIPLPVDVEPEPEEQAPAKYSQLALVGLEHLALATAKAQSMKLASAVSEVSFVNELQAPIDVSRGRTDNGVQFVLRWPKGKKPAREAPVTPDLQVGGQKLGHKAACEALAEAMSKRGYAIAPDFARQALGLMGWPDLDFVLSKVDDSIERCRANRTRFVPAWLRSSIAGDIKATWPSEKKLRAAAVAAAAPRPVKCKACGDFGVVGTMPRDITTGQEADLYAAGELKVCKCEAGRLSRELYDGLLRDRKGGRA